MTARNSTAAKVPRLNVILIPIIHIRLDAQGQYTGKLNEEREEVLPPSIEGAKFLLERRCPDEFGKQIGVERSGLMGAGPGVTVNLICDDGEGEEKEPEPPVKVET